METYTMKKWSEDRTFKAVAGQHVTEEVFNSFLNDLPPEYWCYDIMQAGEPAKHVLINGKVYPAFITFCGLVYSGVLPSLNRFDMATALKYRS